MTTNKSVRRTAAEIIGFALGWDISDVREGRYQSTRYVSPAVFVCGDDYFCCPTDTQSLPEPDRWGWKPVGQFYGRTVYCAEA